MSSKKSKAKSDARPASARQEQSADRLKRGALLRLTIVDGGTSIGSSGSKKLKLEQFLVEVISFEDDSVVVKRLFTVPPETDEIPESLEQPRIFDRYEDTPGGEFPDIHIIDTLEAPPS